MRSGCLNLVFSDCLKSFQAHPELSNFYMAIVEDIFKAKEVDGDKEIDRFQKTLAEIECKLLKVCGMSLLGNLDFH